MCEAENRDRALEAPVDEVSMLASSEANRAYSDEDEISLSGLDDLGAQSAEAMMAFEAAEASCPVTTSDAVPPGSELTGTVVAVTDDEVFLEFNAKSQGVMPRSQFGKKERIELGRRVDVVAERYDGDGDVLIVNRKGAIQRATWTNLAVGMVVEGRVTGLIKGGLEINLQGIRAFMPASQVNPTPLKDISVLLNETVRCEVIELDRRHKNVLVSRRKIVERELSEAREVLRSALEVGQVRRGVVRNVTDFGAFVDLGGLDGLVHVRDLSWSTVNKVSDMIQPGQEVEVKILKLDAKRERISLGMKQVLPDPWSNIAERYPVGAALKVRVVRVAQFGAFAELESGVEGLIPLSELSWTHVKRTTDVVAVGDVVDAVVIRLDADKRRLALSVKQAQGDPWDGVLDGFSKNSLTKGRVTRLANFGAFVEVAPGVEGLIHISELAEGRVKSCESVVQVGNEVEARILDIDKDNRRISLSLKRAHEPVEAADGKQAEPPKQTKKRKKPLRGGLTSHFEW